jgi:hypothetical protein
MFVQLNNASHHATIILKVAVPIPVGEYDIRSAVGTVLIGTMKETAEVGLDA